jgi:hypothetical protein
MNQRTEDYFDLYQVAPGIWIKVSTMHFSAASSQNYGLPWILFFVAWPFWSWSAWNFGSSVFFTIKQSGPIAEYIDRFSGLVYQLIAF